MPSPTSHAKAVSMIAARNHPGHSFRAKLAIAVIVEA
jgi:hypothetical protein